MVSSIASETPAQKTKENMNKQNEIQAKASFIKLIFVISDPFQNKLNAIVSDHIDESCL